MQTYPAKLSFGALQRDISFWLAVALAVLLVICVGDLWYQRVDILARVAAGLAVVVFAASFLVAQQSRGRTAANSFALGREVDLYSRIFDTSLDLILVTDRQGLLTRVSPSSRAILGYAPDEMAGHVASEFLYPDDLESTRTEMRLARRGREIRNFETRYVHKDGRVVTLDRRVVRSGRAALLHRPRFDGAKAAAGS
jgi:PAS domain S-box-containing protein